MDPTPSTSQAGPIQGPEKEPDDYLLSRPKFFSDTCFRVIGVIRHRGSIKTLIFFFSFRSSTH
jgi:hypothetical protein